MLISLGLVFALLVAPQSQPEAFAASAKRTATLAPADLGDTSSAKPKKVLGASKTARASRSTYAAYLRFPALAPRKGEVIKSIKLRLQVTALTEKGKASLSILPTGPQWSGKQLTHANAPAPTGSQLAASNTLKAKKSNTISLKLAPAAKWLAKGISLQLKNRKAHSVIKFSTTGKTAPRLIVTFGPAPSETPVPSTGKLVFAHYFPPYPMSFDNAAPASDYYSRNYLKATGERGKYAAVGGLLRDRPIARVRQGSDWKLEDMKSEVRAAMAAGIDGFAVDILNTSGQNWDRTVLLMQAAAAVSPSFKIMLQPDTTASAGRSTPAALAAALAKLGSSKSAYRLKDGRLVISPFAAEKNPPAYWRDVLQALKSKHHTPAAFLPLFLNASKMKKYASLSYGFGNWGVRDPRAIAAAPNWASQAHKLGKLWMQPVSVQDVRPNQKIFDEAGNTEALRASWTKAISTKADMVLLTTWNDYSESTSFAPSANHGYSFLDISKYYVDRFKSGRSPEIRGDALYITHRVHPYSARPGYAGIMRQRPAANRIAVRDTVEVLSVLTSAATIQVTVGSKKYTYSAPAGVYAKKFPLQLGYSSATATRNGTTKTKVKTKDRVTTTITQQDLTYHAVSSSGR